MLIYQVLALDRNANVQMCSHFRFVVLFCREWVRSISAIWVAVSSFDWCLKPCVPLRLLEFQCVCTYSPCVSHFNQGFLFPYLRRLKKCFRSSKCYGTQLRLVSFLTFVKTLCDCRESGNSRWFHHFDTHSKK